MIGRRLWFTTVACGGLALLVAVSLAACAGGSSGGGAAPQAIGPAATPAHAAGQSFPKNADGYADISAQELDSMLKSKDKDFWMVNVHVPYAGEIRQTDFFIPYNEIAKYLDRLPGKDAPIVVYCRSGNMSTTAAKQLVRQGYINVMELDGGLNAWKAAGLEVLQKAR